MKKPLLSPGTTVRFKLWVFRVSTVVILGVLVILFAILNAFRGYNYLTLSNIATILNQASFLALLGLAQLVVVLTGGINLAIGSIMVFTCIFAGQFLLEENNVMFLIPVVMMLCLGSLVGFFNGIVITKLHIPSFIATFAIMYIFRGLAWIILGRTVLYRVHPVLRFMAGGVLFNLGGFAFTVPMLITLIVLAVTSFIFKKTSFGRRLYFTGSNETAGRFSGISTDRIIILAHIISGLLCGFCAIMFTGRLNAAEPGMYAQSHFDAVSVVLIGGASMIGGVGDVWTMWVGAVIISVIQSGMNSIQVPSEFQTLVLGALIILAVLVNQILFNKKNVLENQVRDGGLSVQPVQTGL